MKNDNKFEIGKFYKNNNDLYIAVRGKINTTIWGENVLVAESTINDSSLIPISSEVLTEDFTEVEEKEWLEQFTNPEDKSEKD